MRLVVSLIGVLGSWVAILALSWADYGDIDFPLNRFPYWGFHVACVSAFHIWLAFRHRMPVAAGVTTGLASIASAILIAWQYDDSSALFGEGAVVPLVMPGVGIGAAVAVLAAAATLIAMSSQVSPRIPSRSS